MQTNMIQNIGQWRDILNAEMNLREAHNAKLFLTRCATISFSIRRRFQGVATTKASLTRVVCQ